MTPQCVSWILLRDKIKTQFRIDLFCLKRTTFFPGGLNCSHFTIRDACWRVLSPYSSITSLPEGHLLSLKKGRLSLRYLNMSNGPAGVPKGKLATTGQNWVMFTQWMLERAESHVISSFFPITSATYTVYLSLKNYEPEQCHIWL